MDKLIQAWKNFQYYRLYIEPVHGTNLTGNLQTAFNEILNFIFFVPLEFLALMIYTVSKLLNQMNFYEDWKQWAYESSQSVFAYFAGTGSSRGDIIHAVTSTRSLSLISLFLLFSVIYVAYAYFSKRGNFGSKVLHLFAVILLAAAYFTPVSVKGAPREAGGLVMFDTVNNVSQGISNALNQAMAGNSVNKKAEDVADTFYNVVVIETVNYLNTGTKDNSSDPKFDYQKAYDSLGKDSGYLDGGNEQEGVNEWVKADGKHTTERFMVLIIAWGNLGILGLPVLFISLVVAFVRMLILLMILFFPLVLLFSFLPWFQTLVFKFLKFIFGLFFMPAMFSFALAIFVMIGSKIDEGVLSLASQIPGDFGFLTVFMFPTIGLLLKAAVLILSWKNKEKALRFFKVSGTSQVFSSLQRNIKDVTPQNVGQVARGIATGNVLAIASGVQSMRGRQELLPAPKPTAGSHSARSAAVKPSGNNSIEAAPEMKVRSEHSNQPLEKNQTSGNSVFSSQGSSSESANQPKKHSVDYEKPEEAERNENSAPSDERARRNARMQELVEKNRSEREITENGTPNQIRRLQAKKELERRQEISHKQALQENLNQATRKLQLEETQEKFAKQEAVRENRIQETKGLVKNTLTVHPVRAAENVKNLVKTTPAAHRLKESVPNLKQSMLQNRSDKQALARKQRYEKFVAQLRTE